MTKSLALKAAKVEFRSYISEKSRYVSITDQQGPLRDDETRLLAPRRWYIKQTMQWDAGELCWKNKDGRPLIVKHLIWDTVISEMRQLHTHGQRRVWTTIKAKYDGILEDDVRIICQIWYKHGLSQLDRRNQWNLSSSSQDDGPSGDDECSEINDHPQDDESSEVNEQNDASSEINEPLQNNASSEATKSSQDDAPQRNDASSGINKPLHDDASSEATEASQDNGPSEVNDLPQHGASSEVNNPLRNSTSFAQEAAERVARFRTLAEFVDDAFPEAPKVGQERPSKKHLRPRSPSYAPTDDDSDDDAS